MSTGRRHPHPDRGCAQGGVTRVPIEGELGADFTLLGRSASVNFDFRLDLDTRPRIEARHLELELEFDARLYVSDQRGQPSALVDIVTVHLEYRQSSASSK